MLTEGWQAACLHRASPPRGGLARRLRALRAAARAPRGPQGASPLPVRRPRDRRGIGRGWRRRHLHAGLSGGPRSSETLPLRSRDRRGAGVSPRSAGGRLGRAVHPGGLRAASADRLAGRGLAAFGPHPVSNPSRGCERSRHPRRDGRLRCLLRGGYRAGKPASGMRKPSPAPTPPTGALFLPRSTASRLAWSAMRIEG